jgi:predicted TIM-barrel enzyme
MVFGEISWVILRFAAEHRAQKLMFTAGYSKLNAFYKVLLRNTTFIKKLESYGYAVDEEINLAYSGVFALTKIQP